MGEQATSASVHVQLAIKRITPAESGRLIDLALESGQRRSVTVSWADGRQVHADDADGLANVKNHPKTDIIRVDVHYTDDSHLAFEPVHGSITGLGDINDEAVACASRIQKEYEAIPDRRFAVTVAKLVLRASFLVILVSAAILCLHFAAGGKAPYGVVLGCIVAWGLVLVGCGTWSEYLEWRIDPVRTQLLLSQWQRNPMVLIPMFSALIALIAVAAVVYVQLHG